MRIVSPWEGGSIFYFFFAVQESWCLQYAGVFKTEKQLLFFTSSVGFKIHKSRKNEDIPKKNEETFTVSPGKVL